MPTKEYCNLKKKKKALSSYNKGGTDKTKRTLELQVSPGIPKRNYKGTKKGWLTELIRQHWKKLGPSEDMYTLDQNLQILPFLTSFPS